ncbi:DUF222 domain-containing protein [Candidatus Poriferisodalis sp.]|uniref:HNH endonuclease signature motif containing protein n=1 Tax=Candidatus Poriferisodalis sp. TaxID=3101277 RepID=UPI003B51B3DF
MLESAYHGAGQASLSLADASTPATIPSPPRPLVGALNAASSMIGSSTVESGSPDEITAGLAAVSKLRSALDAVEARLIAEAERLDSHCINTEQILHRLGRSVPAAKRTMRRGRMLDKMPRIEAALAAGEITAEHADALITAAEMTDAASADSAEHLLTVASSSSPERTRRVVGEWVRERGEGLTPNERYERQRRLRTMSFGRTDEGLLRATLLLDDVGGAALRSVVDDAAQRFFEADRADRSPEAPEPRSFGQCRVDALEALLGIGSHRATQRWYDEDPHRLWDRIDVDWKGPRPLDLPALAPAHQCNLPSDAANGTLTLPEAHRLCASGHPGADQSVGPSLGNPSDGPRRRNQVVVVADLRAVMGDDNAAIEICDSGPLPQRVFERLACHADIYGIVFDGDGQPLWHGRRVRTVTDAQWRALVARDRRCVLCDAGPQWCEAHHVIPWQPPARGRTDIDNLVLLCGRCHHQVHDSPARLRRGSRNCWWLDFTCRQE